MSQAEPIDLNASGRCDCGAVTISAHGRIVSMLLCACENCQRATGTGHSAIALVPAAALQVTGSTKSYSRPADSGATFTRHFCIECGGTIFGQSSRAPDLRMLPVGLFAGHNDWFRPNQVIFARSRFAWDLLPEHVPHHQTYRNSP